MSLRLLFQISNYNKGGGGKKYMVVMKGLDWYIFYCRVLLASALNFFINLHGYVPIRES